MSSESGSGSGADQHLLALLRAIRLRQAAPDAVDAGAADTAAALSDLARRRAAEAGPPGAQPPGLLPGAIPPRPGWAEPHPAPGATAEPHPSPGATADDDAELAGEAGMPVGEADAGLRASAADFFGRSTAAKPGRSDKLGPPPPHPAGGETSAEGGSLLLPPVDPLRTAGDDGYGPEGEDRVGRLSRNRFAGLGPGQPSREPAAPEPAGGPASGAIRPVEKQPGTARPGWASGEPEHGVRPRVPHFEGMMPPTVAASGPAPSSDGRDPADDALLRQTQRLLSTSLTFAGGPGDVADRLRAALYQAHPSLLAILPGDAGAQADRLAVGLTWLVHHLDQPPLLVNGCAALGRVLAGAGVELDRLRLVGPALAEAMRAGMAPGEWRQEFDVAWRSTWQHLYEWIRHGVATAPYDQTSWTAVVVSHELRRPDLAVIRVRPHLPLPFRAGQYARVEVPELPGIWRPYSLAGAPRRNDLVELHVRAKTHNGVSGTLVYRTREGDQLRLSRPEGQMGLPESPQRDLLMIAGDTGVAPLKALLTELADTRDPRSAVLFWGVRNLDELYDIDDIAEIARTAKRATVVPVVSEGDPGPYASGLVTDAVAAYGEWSRHEVYLAGPPLMLASTSAALHQLGVAPDHIHHDAPE
ncbi:FAD-binding oxidoreductase [Actinoplanes sp. NPDC026619]|uniref:FAD-binding oxidoreductase n=1 Tax=Actinoplanes sp. NPDC026619 TaxID=3155798 RepID=UPI0033FC9AF4